jgi:transposase
LARPSQDTSVHKTLLMKKPNTNTHVSPSVVPTVPPSTAPVVPSGFTLGLDLGDRRHFVCALDAAGKVSQEGFLANSRPALLKLLAQFPRATVAMEAGTHSPWLSRFLTEQGAKVIVANPRKLHAISRHERKCDQRDAQMLARLARVDAALLHPIEHGSAQAQHDLLGLKLRDALVRSRVSLINAVRFTLKSLGHPVRNPSSESFHKTVLQEIPAACQPVVQPLLGVLEHITAQIKSLERQLVQRSKRDYPVTQRLQQVAGVGPLTALCFVLKIGDPKRFNRARDVGAYLGLCPRRDQSGGTDKQLRITKCGDGLLRRLLVNAAHYVLGPFGPACALREHGARLTGSGSVREKKRAVVAVARKLAVLLLSLWKHGKDYELRPRALPPLRATA